MIDTNLIYLNSVYGYYRNKYCFPLFHCSSHETLYKPGKETFLFEL